MQRNEDATYSRRLRGVSAVILFALILSTLRCSATAVVSVASTPQLIVSSPSANSLNVVNAQLGDTITMDVNLTDFSDLYTWQIVLKYNATILSLTDAGYPDGNVFSGHNVFTLSQDLFADVIAIGDTVDYLNWTQVGASLIGDPQGVNVANGLLFELTFAVVGTGQTNVLIATMDSPVTSFVTPWYSYCLDSVGAEGGGYPQYTDFVTRGLTVLSGVLNALPVAIYNIEAPPADNATYLILWANPPTGVVNLRVVYEGLPAYFNASNSYAPTGSITSYIWDFGDGNTTVVNASATSADASFITHVYQKIGRYDTSLIVVSNGTDGSQLQSAPASILVIVDLAIPYYDWTWLMYLFFALVVAVILISAVRSVMRRVRRRSALNQRKMLAAGPSDRTPTGAQTT